MASSPRPAQVPVIDLSAAREEAGRAQVAAEIDQAASELGFFYVTGHGVEARAIDRLLALSRAFFELPEETKQRIHMRHGGRAWRGFFPVGGELTSGRPDLKEGIYFGEELREDDPRVQGAFGELVWTGSWYEADVALDPLGAESASPALVEAVTCALLACRRMGHDLHVLGAAYVPLKLGLDVCALPGYERGHVLAALLRDRKSVV